MPPPFWRATTKGSSDFDALQEALVGEEDLGAAPRVMWRFPIAVSLPTITCRLETGVPFFPLVFMVTQRARRGEQIPSVPPGSRRPLTAGRS